MTDLEVADAVEALKRKHAEVRKEIEAFSEKWHTVGQADLVAALTVAGVVSNAVLAASTPSIYALERARQILAHGERALAYWTEKRA